LIFNGAGPLLVLLAPPAYRRQVKFLSREIWKLFHWGGFKLTGIYCGFKLTEIYYGFKWSPRPFEFSQSITQKNNYGFKSSKYYGFKIN